MIPETVRRKNVVTDINKSPSSASFAEEGDLFVVINDGVGGRGAAIYFGETVFSVYFIISVYFYIQVYPFCVLSFGILQVPILWCIMPIKQEGDLCFVGFCDTTLG